MPWLLGVLAADGSQVLPKAEESCLFMTVPPPWAVLIQ